MDAQLVLAMRVTESAFQRMLDANPEFETLEAIADEALGDPASWHLGALQTIAVQLVGCPGASLDEYDDDIQEVWPYEGLTTFTVLVNLVGDTFGDVVSRKFYRLLSNYRGGNAR